MIVIVDYGMGNLKSVQKAGEFLGEKVRITSSVNAIKKAKKIIFPGQGHFAQAVKELKKRKMFALLQDRIKEGVPFLGICVGMQLLLESSEEAQGISGLGIIKGKVKKFKGKSLIVPHMGWNSVEYVKKDMKKEKLFKGVPDNTYFYFAHSYYCDLSEKDIILGVTDYGKTYVSAFHKDNVWAAQFHPEKSQKFGLKVFNNFLKLC